MHGRVKVKTTEEQEKTRREEKETKLKVFRLATNTIFENRRSKVYDRDTLRLISEVVSKVPDWFTLWNYRREIIDHLKPSLEDLENNVAKEKYITLLQRELDLTRHCLLENPKSYSTWHHRCWVMLKFPTPDWKRELDLCNTALSLDERNFHCWDYRRFVVSHAKIAPVEEFEFTTNKLTTNFSDFSSWHYRSTLLPLMSVDGNYDNENSTTGLSESVIREEMNLIHNAVFTDPSDQSPWFYHRWLLTKGPKKTHCRQVYINRRLERLILVFAKPETILALNSMEVKIEVLSSDGSALETISQKPSSSTSVNDDYLQSVSQSLPWVSALSGDISSVWWLTIPHELLYEENKVHVTIRPDVSLNVMFRCQMNSNVMDSLVRVSLDSHRMFNHYIALDNEEILRDELEVVRELYDLEPNNKWVLLTMLSFLRYTSPEDTMMEAEQILQKLSNVDPLRTNYYSDLRSRYTLENAIMGVYQNSERSLHLPGVGLTRLSCLEWLPLLTVIDFSGNKLSILPAECAYLICLVEFNLNDNQLMNLSSLSQLIALQQLTLRNNSIESFDGLEPVLCCSKLLRLDITGNAVAKLADLTDRVACHPQSKMHAHPLAILYDKII